MNILSILIVMMVSWVQTYIKTYHSVYFVACFLYINIFLKIFIYLFLAAPCLRCFAQVFSSCREQGLLIAAVHGLLNAVASLVEDHRL